MEPEQFTLKDGRTVLIRGPKVGDGQRVYDYLLALGASTPYILTFPGDMGLVEDYEENAKRVESGVFYSICAIDPQSDTLVGSTVFGYGSRVKNAHVADLGTGVLPDWQGVGLGSWMLDRAIEDMRANPKIHRLELTVMDGNDHAQRMYERAGFVVEGRKVKSIHQPDGSYADEILMGMWIGD